ncbi:chromate transporter [soil metagenome]
MSSHPSLSEIAFYFLALSLMAIGGANAVIPDMHRQLVEVAGWMSSSEFVALVALSQAAPGPNVLIVSLLGWKVAGLSGALVATAAMCVPSSLLTYFFSRFWQRFEAANWRTVAQNGLAPVTIGLILASGYVLTREADHNWVAYAITGLTAALVAGTRIHPLYLLAVAGSLGWAGLV